MGPAPVSAADAVSGIKSGERVFAGGFASTPTRLLAALAARGHALRNVRVAHLMVLGEAPHAAPELQDAFSAECLFIGASTRTAVLENRADFTPVFLHEAPRLLAGKRAVDWALVQLTPPDRHGFCSTGPSGDITIGAIRHAKHVVAELNPNLPRTHGDTLVHVSRLDAVVAVEDPVIELPPPAVTPAMRRISEQIAGLIEDGDCLQIGIGGIPNTVLELIADRRHLGVHTEMLTDGMAALYATGAIDGSRKAIMPGKIVCTFAAGRRALYDFIDDNPIVELHPCDFTNDPFVIARNDNVVAINSALQIDLTGQVDADSVGTHLYSGIGGQVDFIRGASRSKGGRPIIAIPSTAMGGKVSRIVPTLSPGAGVVTSRGDVHHIVTEYGHVDLFGLGVHARAKALISIAHPDFREELSRQAHELRLTWGEDHPMRRLD
ncbi:MAG: acetyl-CoA hydrolase/transferase C-terminal domain-containing protein [Acetobacteraceae bacterium]|nr:acetyl-CoA hydrolase/transferase family protein [Pseudomonadota bacterium]